jgi:RNA polymerase sigma factor (sigma-70 family)
VATHKKASDRAPGSAPDSLIIEETYGQYRAELRAFFARRARQPDDVEDLVQLVYERLLRYRPRAQVENPLKYLFRIAWNVLMAESERARRDQGVLTCDTAELESHAQGLRSLWVQDNSGEALAQDEFERVLRQLPRACQAALLLQRRDGRSYEEIAAELDVSVNTVKDYIVKALEHFRKHFSMSHPS